MLDQKELRKLNTGDEINHYLLISKIEKKTAKNNKEYLNLELRDQSVALSAKLWDNFDGFYTKAEIGSLIKVAGVLEDYMGQSQIRILKYRLANENDNVTPEDFLPKSGREFGVMAKELEDRIIAIEDKNLKKLVTNILNGERLKKYLRVPAGKSWHHSYIHGLLEHTLEIIRICDLMCDIHPEVNRDLVVCGAILHDSGKVEELSYESSFDYTDKGKLIGHIVIAAMYIESEAQKIEGFPTELKDHLMHLILSHQGKLEYATPVEPKTLEAIILYNADELSAKTNAYKLAIKAEQNGENKWTRYLPLANTSLYIPDWGKEGEEEPKETFFD